MASGRDAPAGQGGGQFVSQEDRDDEIAHEAKKALIVNAAMFLVEMVAGTAADSRALQADALDFLGDAGNYAISLAVVGAVLTWRARAALVIAG